MLLAGGRAGENAKDCGGVLQRRHHFLETGDHDLHAGQGLGEIGVSFVGDQNDRPRLGDQHVGAGDPDIGGEELAAQHRAGLFEHDLRIIEHARGRVLGVMLAECIGDLLLGEMHGRCDDVARRLVAELNDVFAKIGFDGTNAFLFETLVDRDFLADHRFGLGDGSSAGVPTNPENRLPGFFGIHAPVNLPAGFDDFRFEPLQVEIQVLEDMVLDVPRRVAQGFEFRQSFHGQETLGRKAFAEAFHRRLQIDVGDGFVDVCLERVGCRFHPSSLRPSRHLRLFYSASPIGGTSSVIPVSASAM